MLDPGQHAPEFELPNHDGEPVRRSDFEGKPVVLYFYPEAGTKGCTIEARGFREHWEEFVEAGVQVVGISTDPVEAVSEFAAAEELPFPLLSDEDGEVAREYDVFGTPEVDGETYEIAFRHTYVVDENGEIAAAYEDVSPDEHAQEILADHFDVEQADPTEP